MDEENVRVDEITSVELVEAQQRAEYDVQIVTAKRYPRDLTRVRNNAIAIATGDKSTAESCRYALPRGNRSIAGPSVHLARIMAQQYGNLRADSKVKAILDKEIVSEAVAFDLETNYAVKVEVRRRIIDKHGNRFNDDMITVTGNAANAIAYRNAVFSVIPKSIIDSCYNAALQLVTGDLSDETKLIQARTKWLKYFKDKYAATEAEVLRMLNINTVNQIGAEAIANLAAFNQAIADGDSTPDEIFGRVNGEKTTGKPASEQAGKLFNDDKKA